MYNLLTGGLNKGENMKKIIALAILASTMIPPCGMLHAKMSKKEKKQITESFIFILERESEIIDMIGSMQRELHYLHQELDELYEMHADYDPDVSKCDRY